MSKGKEVTTTTALPDELASAFVPAAKPEADAGRPALGAGESNVISTNGKKFSIDEVVIGDTFQGVVLNYVLQNVYYESEYDPDDFSFPECFALSADSRATMGPPPDAPKPQAEQCAGCWANKFRSGPRGRGKACKNRVRMAVVPVDALDGPTYQLSISPLGMKNFRRYVTECEQRHGRVVAGVLTNFRFDEKAAYPVVTAEMERLLEVDELRIIMPRLKPVLTELLDYSHLLDDDNEGGVPDGESAKPDKF